MDASKLLSLLSTIIVLVNVLNTRNNTSHQVYAYSDAQIFGQFVNSISYRHLSFFEHYCSSYFSQRLEGNPFHLCVHILTGFLQYNYFVVTSIRVQGQNVLPVLIHIFKKRVRHFIHINIRSLLPKLDELRLIARETNAACISETWLDDSVFDSELPKLQYSSQGHDSTWRWCLSVHT